MELWKGLNKIMHVKDLAQWPHISVCSMDSKLKLLPIKLTKNPPTLSHKMMKLKPQIQYVSN